VVGGGSWRDCEICLWGWGGERGGGNGCSIGWMDVLFRAMMAECLAGVGLYITISSMMISSLLVVPIVMLVVNAMLQSRLLYTPQ